MDARDTDDKAHASEGALDSRAHRRDDAEKEAELRSSIRSSHPQPSITHQIAPASTTVGDQNLCDEGANMERVVTPRREAVKVARASRRGLLGRFALVAEVVEPHDYSNRTKWFITFVVAFAAAAAPLGSAIVFRTLLTDHGAKMPSANRHSCSVFIPGL